MAGVSKLLAPVLFAPPQGRKNCKWVMGSVLSYMCRREVKCECGARCCWIVVLRGPDPRNDNVLSEASFKMLEGLGLGRGWSISWDGEAEVRGEGFFVVPSDPKRTVFRKACGQFCGPCFVNTGMQGKVDALKQEGWSIQKVIPAPEGVWVLDLP